MSLVYPGGGWEQGCSRRAQHREHSDPSIDPLHCLQLLNGIPVLLNIPGLPDKVFSGKKAFMALQDELLTEHKMTRDPTQPPRDLTDAFLAEVEKVIGKRWGQGLWADVQCIPK